MPKLLTSDVIRLLNGSVETLRLAHTGIGLPRTDDCYDQPFCFAPEMGLVGAAADLALKACVRQVAGQKALLRTDGGFKTASETLTDFRKLLRSDHPRVRYFFSEVEDRDAHTQSILSAASRFRVLFSVRAAALHMAEGTSRDVLVHTWNGVADFLRLLGYSRAFAPYIRELPAPITVAKQRDTLMSELSKAASEAPDVKDAGSALVGICLIMPELPEEEPEWIEALDRVAVSPTRRDVKQLVAALEEAVPTRLFRVSGSGDGQPVRIDPDDPHAVPIEPHFLKRSFTDPADRFHADIANANGRLDEGELDLPPTGFVNQLFAFGFDEVGLPPEELALGLTAHQTWPIVASSLNCASNHITGPVWFAIDRLREDEMGQLVARLRKAAECGNRGLHNWIERYTDALDAFTNDSTVARNSELVLSCIIKRDSLSASLASRFAWSTRRVRRPRCRLR